MTAKQARGLRRSTIREAADRGHALPHEQPELLHVLLIEWLARIERSN